MVGKWRAMLALMDGILIYNTGSNDFIVLRFTLQDRVKKV